MQNTTHAVMAQRTEPKDSSDDFPTPPWATRGLLEHVLNNHDAFFQKSCLEPACGAGHMAGPLAEYFGSVIGSDVHDYGYGKVCDFLSGQIEFLSFDWVITNPPFRLGEEFVLRALSVAREGVAIFARTAFIEGVGRYQKIFSRLPPTKIAQFVERVPIVKGRLDQKATTATSYAWIAWEKASMDPTRLLWIPLCRRRPRRLERATDYDLAPNRSPTSTAAHRHHDLLGSADGEITRQTACDDRFCSVADPTMPGSIANEVASVPRPAWV
jgi:hypothetical protein